MSPKRVLLSGVVGGTAAAVMLPLHEPGLGWVLTALAVFALVRKVVPGWAVLSVLLFGTGVVVASEWLFVLCAVAGCAAGSLAVAGGRSGVGLVLGSAAVPAAALRAVPWVVRGLRGVGVSGLVRPVLVTVGLLLVFVPLLAGADVAFAAFLGSAVPEVDGSAVLVFVAVGCGVVGACFLVSSPPAVDDRVLPERTVALRDWAMPVGALVGLFAAFVGVQVTTLFGGDEYVLRTAGVTYAEYARRGFWQLLAVAVLTLVVIAVTAALADVEADARWVRGLLGALTVLTLVIVASALARMWVYQQAYGFTVLRVLVAACELWLAVVYLMVLAAGVRLRGGWLARGVVGTGFAALVGLALLNPERFIAERNVARWEATGRIDLVYLARLSPDAAPVLARLPESMRLCVLRGRTVSEDDWRSWNLGRAEARRVLAALPDGWCAR